MLPKRAAWRVFLLVLVLSVLAMIASNSYRGILQFSTVQPSPRRRISTIDSYIEAILDDANIENSTVPISNENLTLTVTAENASVSTKQVFLMDAYLVDDRLIRITTIRKCKSKMRLTFYLRFNATTFAMPTNSQPIQACPWFFAKKCDFVGYFTQISVPKVIMPTLVSESMPEAFVSTERDKGIRHRVRLHDARAKKPTRKHELAVCLQPIFLLADWTILIQFFETWIVQGATKFYVYVHSMAPEVDALLRVYESDRSVDIERIPWAPLPIENGTPSAEDPNFFIYRTEVVTAVNDCVLRSRGKAKYVVSSDLDEIIVPFHNRSLLSLLHSFKTASPTAAAFIFLSSYAMFENCWAEVKDPASISFGNFAEVKLEKYIWPSGLRSKVIMVPELIRGAHVHNVLRTENRSKIVTVREDDAIVFHLRRVAKRGNITTNGTKTSRELARFIKPCEKLWSERQKRIRDIPGTEILHAKIWPNRGLQVMNELEKCLVHDFRHRAETCNSLFKCIDAIQAVSRNEWVWAKQTWTLL
uniref:Glycosyltransferase family 92 protein n=2 Tax=Parascaris univalens TaxID=6257 RepID=A0A915ASB8_PARUN